MSRRRVQEIVRPVTSAFVLLAAMVQLCACAGARNVPLDTIRDAGREADGQDDPLVGAYVRVELDTGEQVTGLVRGIENGDLTLERPRDYSFRERTLASAAIIKVEVIEEASARQPRLTLVGAVASAVVALVLVALSQIRIE